MEGQPSTGNFQYQHQPAPWPQLVRRNTLADAAPYSSPVRATSAQHPGQLDLLPILLPQQSSYHQAQLAQYNRLITSGRASRVPSSPLPQTLSAQHIQAAPRPRAGSSGGNTARNTKSAARGGHGNKEASNFSTGERALVAEKDNPETMPPKKFDLSNQLPSRPLAQRKSSSLSEQSRSVPTTPHQHARKFSFESREPSPTATSNHSPRSAYSESNITLPSSRPLPPPRGGCRYETAMAHTKRRMPYSIGGEKLERLNTADIKSKLSEDEERTLSTDMRELYDRLLPTPESESKRKKLVQKLEKLLNDEWPGHDIQVHVFGSSGNLLFTDESDVDICITTDWRELEGVCVLADLLAKNGMERVICVSTAKVPIVKIWDPELCLACDMNVNNTLALENTRMIKTYVEIDPRVRPLAMIIKQWTKKRILNDAAFGGTLSSYTWICLIINFLQSRDPPVLPALHQLQNLKLPSKNGLESTFADDIAALQGFGEKNKESLGELLFHFFRFYSHEFDYDKLVVSVRTGKQISKVEKKWHLANNNTLCVEEPFNIGRNLGNTADDTSFRGLHMELRRAFDLISAGKLAESCEQYEYPKEEERVWERPAPKPRPILRSTSQASRGARGGTHRGGRHSNPHNRNGNNNRRASSGAFDAHLAYGPGGLPPQVSPQDAWLQQQAQAQVQLHNDLFTTYSVLQAQENTLRLQLYSQSQAYAQAQAHAQAFAQSQGRAQGNGGNATQHPTDRNRTNSFDQPPLSAPIRPDMYFYPLQYQAAPIYGYQNPSTNPPSPSMSSAVPELRRGIHRATITNGSGPGGPSNSSLRSHSQPPARSPSQLHGPGMLNHPLNVYQPLRPANGIPIPSFIADERSDGGLESSAGSVATTPPDDTTPKEYVGYYVNDKSPSPMRKSSLQPMSIPAFGDLGHTRRRLSTDQLPQSILNRLKRNSRSPSPLGHGRSFSTEVHSAPITAVPALQGLTGATTFHATYNQGPVVVNGSTLPASASISNFQGPLSEGSYSEDHISDATVGSIHSISQFSQTASDLSDDIDFEGQATPKESRTETQLDPPAVVNSSTPRRNDSSPKLNGPAVANGVSSREVSNTKASVAAESLNGTPTPRNRLARQAQNGGVPHLDISSSQNEASHEDTSYLSPVYEARTPSPTASRKFEPSMEPKTMGFLINANEEMSEHPKAGARLGTAKGNPSKPASTSLKSNGHTRAAKSEGGELKSWQKIPKSKKKGVSTELKSAANGQPLSERPPKDDSERKGG